MSRLPKVVEGVCDVFRNKTCISSLLPSLACSGVKSPLRSGAIKCPLQPQGPCSVPYGFGHWLSHTAAPGWCWSSCPLPQSSFSCQVNTVEDGVTSLSNSPSKSLCHNSGSDPAFLWSFWVSLNFLGVSTLGTVPSSTRCAWPQQVIHTFLAIGLAHSAAGTLLGGDISATLEEGYGKNHLSSEESA